MANIYIHHHGGITISRVASCIRLHEKSETLNTSYYPFSIADMIKKKIQYIQYIYTTIINKHHPYSVVYLNKLIS